MRVLGLCLTMIFLSAVPAVHTQPPQQPTAAQDGFVPVDQLPAGDAMPAAPLLITAYAAAWLAMVLYIVSLWWRLGRVEREIAVLGQRVQETQRGARK